MIREEFEKRKDGTGTEHQDILFEARDILTLYTSTRKHRVSFLYFTYLC